MSKQHGWKTVLYVNGGNAIVNDSLLRVAGLRYARPLNAN